MFRTVLSGLAASLATSAFAVNGYVATVECPYPDDVDDIRKIQITSFQKFSETAPPVAQGLSLFFGDGRVEAVAPARQTDAFGNVIAPRELAFVQGRGYFPEASVGAVQVRFRCFHSPGVPWERCRSQGTGEHGRHSGVELNLGGRILKFLGDDLCTRSVEAY